VENYRWKITLDLNRFMTVSLINDIFQFTANPNEASHSYQEFEKNFKTPLKINNATKNFLKIFGNSGFLSRFIINNPQTYSDYLKSPYQEHEKPLENFQKEIAKIVSHKNAGAQFFEALKKYKYTEYIRITIKELLGLNQIMIYREISSLAIAIVQVLTRSLLNDLKKKYSLKNNQDGDFAILAMGKLGGLELNYSSDIDLIGLYDQDQNYTSTTSHEFFVKLFAQLGLVLTEMDQNGFLFRVDWDLRPEGKSGTLANSLNAMDEYYESFGAEWERQAYIKSRTLFQQKDLGDQFLSLLTPFIYRKTFDEKTIKNTWDMKAKIVQELKKNSSNGINIKLDEGGIRDIEFFIQGFQLLYGGKIKALRDPNTLSALKQLNKNKLISKETETTLEKSYLFLRRLESCIQMENEQQSHLVKNNSQAKIKLARRMGITLPEDDAVNLLDEELTDVRYTVKKIFHEVYGR